MAKINETRLNGTVEYLKEIPTKSGARMIAFFLVHDSSKFKTVAFKNIADAIILAGNGSEISVSGTAAINNYKDKEGNWKSDFQLTVWGVEIHGQKYAYGKDPETKQEQEPKPGKGSGEKMGPGELPPGDFPF